MEPCQAFKTSTLVTVSTTLSPQTIPSGMNNAGIYEKIYSENTQ
jgi:hypothetical protein